VHRYELDDEVRGRWERQTTRRVEGCRAGVVSQAEHDIRRYDKEEHKPVGDWFAR